MRQAGLASRSWARRISPLPLLEACNFPADPEGAATVTLPQWWFEVITTFRDLYEPSEAEYRAQKVLNKLIGQQMEREDPARFH